MLWNEIHTGQLKFSRAQVEVKELKSVIRLNLLEYFWVTSNFNLIYLILNILKLFIDTHCTAHLSFVLLYMNGFMVLFFRNWLAHPQRSEKD